ncbi:MAG: hypothetical protein ABIQ99_07075, partial [Thermoflexales bacterium]
MFTPTWQIDANGSRISGAGASGLDVLAPVGTPIHVGASGRVAAVQEFKVRGLVVIVDHGRGV